jgi:hypothetical protein
VAGPFVVGVVGVVAAAATSVFATGCGRLDFDAGTGALDAARGSNDGAASDAAASILGHATMQTNVGPAASSASVTFTVAPTIGDTLVIVLWGWSNSAQRFGPGAVTDDAGNSYALAVQEPICNVIGALYYAHVTATHAGLAVTVVSPVVGQISMIGEELMADASLDSFATMNNGAMGSPATFASGALTTTHTDDVYFSVGVPCAFSMDPFVWADNSGFATLAIETNAVTYAPGIAGTLAPGTAGTFQDNWTVTYDGGENMPAGGLLAAFR